MSIHIYMYCLFDKVHEHIEYMSLLCRETKGAKDGPACTHMRATYLPVIVMWGTNPTYTHMYMCGLQLSLLDRKLCSTLCNSSGFIAVYSLPCKRNIALLILFCQ